MSGDMYLRNFFVFDISAPSHKMINYLSYRPFISGYCLCREDYCIAILYFYVFMLISGNPRQDAHGLALTAGGNDNSLMIINILKVFELYPRIRGHLKITHFKRYLGIAYHAPAAHNYPPSVLHSNINCLLYPMDI